MRKSQTKAIAPILAIALLLAVEGNARAMHIKDGILSMGWCVLWFALAFPFVAWGLRDLTRRNEQNRRIKPLIGLVGAAVFVVSCMPVPLPTGTCSHPCGTGLAAILIGPWLTVVISSAVLLLQALFLSHGGLSTLGANVLSMGVAGAFTGYGVFKLARHMGASWFVAAFLAGILSDWATYATTSMELALALHQSMPVVRMFGAVLLAFVPTQVPLGLIEGFVSAGAYRFVAERRPEFLQHLMEADKV